jgi:ribosomal protein S18 acetylase RimI-like enzyme
MVIQDLTREYLDSFYDCFSLLMREGYGQFPKELCEYFLTHDYTKINFALWLERNVRKNLILVNEYKQVVGFLIGDHTYGGVGFISWFGLVPEIRKQGWGSKMLAIYEDYARGKKGHLLELYTYDGAKGFYSKHGFVEIGRREQGFFGQLNLIMNKKLSDWSLANLPD